MGITSAKMRMILVVAVSTLCVGGFVLAPKPTNAGMATSAMEVSQKLSLQTGQTKEITVPAVNKPMKILIGTLSTAIPTQCHGSVQIRPGASDGVLMGDLGTGLTTASVVTLQGHMVSPGSIEPSSAELQIRIDSSLTDTSLNNPADLKLQVFGFATENCGSGVLTTHEVDGVPVDVLITFMW